MDSLGICNRKNKGTTTMQVYIVLHRQSATNVTSNFAQFMESLKGGGITLPKKEIGHTLTRMCPIVDTAP